MSMGLRQRPELGEGRPIRSVWPGDEAEQVLRNPGVSQRANSSAFTPPAFNPLEMFQQQQRASHEEQLREYERNLQLQERLKRGLYDSGALPFERPMSLPGGGPGINLDMMNAMARLQGLDIQDPNSQIRPARPLGSFKSSTLSHQSHHPFVPNEFGISHFDTEGHWPDIDSHMPNDWVESHIQRLQLNAEQQKREHQLDEENSKRMLMELLHQNSIRQSAQLLKEGVMERMTPSGFFPGSSTSEHLFSLHDCDAALNNRAAVASFPNIAGEQTQLQLSEEHAGGLDSSRRLPDRSNSGIAMEGESIYPGLGQSSTLLYATTSMSGNSGTDTEFSEMEGKRLVSKLEDITRGSVEISEIMSKQSVMLLPDGREIPAGSINRQSSHGIAGGQTAFLNDKIGRSNSFAEEIARERTPTVLSRGSENALLKRPPVSRPLSSQEGSSDLAVDPAKKATNTVFSIPDGGRREVRSNAVQAADTSSTRKGFRRTNSCDGDVSETSFVDLLKSNTKKLPQPEAHAAAGAEFADGNQIGGKSGKKKGKKGRQIDPALLGFKVTSNRIMMGEIQRIED
ncbi:hypothetical protein Cgig2_018124 [Carnegiea gigantea]|uniref:Uncharacterized protein n=1 Tax=Carnegiea gigantea TaxID=171969 RepID=A0A9Q1KX43_9CARY|nr:hypothetical protein Cgig2_018124 [Carnegiea gigantea]